MNTHEFCGMGAEASATLAGQALRALGIFASLTLTVAMCACGMFFFLPIAVLPAQVCWATTRRKGGPCGRPTRRSGDRHAARVGQLASRPHLAW